MLKHNKKRNVYIIYEQLMSVVAKLICQGHKNEAKYVLEITKKYYSPKTAIGKEFKIFDLLLKKNGLNKDTAQQVISEAISQAKSIPSSLEKEKDALLKDIRENISLNIHHIPVGDYKAMASVQILLNEERTLSKDTTPLERVKIKNQLFERVCNVEPKKDEDKIDSFTYKLLFQKYSDRYYKLINEDQKDILKAYNLYLVNEDKKHFLSIISDKLKNIKKDLMDAINKDDIKEKDLKTSLNEAYKKLNNTKYDSCDDESVYEVMRYLDLVEDLKNV